jgi:hypothetical protein
VKSTNGDTFLGGEDFDSKIVEYLADGFKKDEGIDLRGDKLALQRLKEAAEKAKIELSSAATTEVNSPSSPPSPTAEAPGEDHHPRRPGKAGRGPDQAHARTVQEGDQGRRRVGKRYRRSRPGRRHDPHAARARNREGILRQGTAHRREPRRSRRDRRRDPGGVLQGDVRTCCCST